MHLLQIVRTVTIVRSSQQRCSVRKGVLRNFAKFTGKHLGKTKSFLRIPFLQNTSRWLLLNYWQWSQFSPLSCFYIWIISKQPFRGVLMKRCSENIVQIHRRTPMPKYDFNKVALQLYWNHTSAWAFSCKYTAYFQNTFSWEHLEVASSGKNLTEKIGALCFRTQRSCVTWLSSVLTTKSLET